MLVLATVSLCFCAWAVYLGGLASMQATCVNAPDEYGTANIGTGVGFDPNLQCSVVFSYWWFVMSVEFVAVGFALFVAMMPAMLSKYRMSLLGLFVICTILYIDASNSWYSLLVSSNYYSDTGSPQIHKLRTTVAGSIMTATLNGIAVVVLGMKDEEERAYETKEPTAAADKGAAATAV